MSEHRTKMCCRCKQRGVEVIDDWESTQCSRCNDVQAEHERERREFEYYHSEDKL